MPTLSLDELTTHYQAHHDGQPGVIEALEGQKLAIRGFVHRTPENELILAPTPQVRSCCLGAPTKRGQQLFLEGSFTPPALYQVAEVAGEFHLETQVDPPKMILKQVSMEEGVSISSLQLFLAALVLLTLGALGFLYYRRRSI